LSEAGGAPPVSHGPEAATKEAPESPDAVESAAEGRGGGPA